MWKALDFNGNNKVSLAEIDKLVEAKYPVLNNKPALMRAYKYTTLREGDKDAYVEKNEFPSLLRNLLYFNRAYAVFDQIDTSDDRRVDLGELIRGSKRERKGRRRRRGRRVGGGRHTGRRIATFIDTKAHCCACVQLSSRRAPRAWA
jgi:hypothetical protein